MTIGFIVNAVGIKIKIERVGEWGVIGSRIEDSRRSYRAFLSNVQRSLNGMNTSTIDRRIRNSHDIRCTCYACVPPTKGWNKILSQHIKETR